MPRVPATSVPALRYNSSWDSRRQLRTNKKVTTWPNKVRNKASSHIEDIITKTLISVYLTAGLVPQTSELKAEVIFHMRLGSRWKSQLVRECKTYFECPRSKKSQYTRTP